jgi:hypothetical protein
VEAVISLSSIARLGRRGNGFCLGLGWELFTNVLRAGRPGPADIDASSLLFAVGEKGGWQTIREFQMDLGGLEKEGGRDRHRGVELDF